MEMRSIHIRQAKLAAYNPRKDLLPEESRMKKIRRSVQEFGLVVPLVWNEKTGNLVSGHQRLKALKDTGAESVEVSVVNLNKDDERALNIALNKIEGAWDFDKLREVLEELGTDAELSGFDDDETKALLATFHDAADDTGLEEEETELAIPENLEPFRVYFSFDSKQAAQNFLDQIESDAVIRNGVANVDLTE